MTSFAEIKALKEELSKKGSMLVKLKEDKLGSRSGRSSDLSPAKSSGDREKDELKKQIKQLETKLSGINKAEKPLESLVPLPEDQDQPKDSVEKQVSHKITLNILVSYVQDNQYFQIQSTYWNSSPLS